MKECDLSNAYNNRFPKAILISAGGNDLIVSALRYMIEYEASSYDGTINSAFLDAMVGRVGRMMTEYISALIMICNATLSRADCINTPIFLHGYDYVKASGDSYKWHFYKKGPWLKPIFESRGHGDPRGNNGEIREIINKLNNALCDVAAKFQRYQPAQQPVYFLDFRNRINHNWEDEIHPNEAGFGELAGLIATGVTSFHTGGDSRDSLSNKACPNN